MTTNLVAVEEEAAESPVVEEPMEAVARTVTLREIQALNRSWRTRVTEVVVAEPPGFAEPSPSAGPDGPAPLLVLVGPSPTHAHAPRPAPGHGAALSAAPSLFVYQPSDGISRRCSIGTCSNVCAPSVQS